MRSSSFRVQAACAGIRIGWDLVRTLVRPPQFPASASRPPPTTVRRAAECRRPPREAFRIATWNIHRGYDVEGVARGLQRLLAEASPDVLLLQEVPVWPSGPWWEHPSVRTLMAPFDVLFAPMHRVARPRGYYPFVSSGPALLSRWRLGEVSALVLPQVSRAKLGRRHRVERVALLADLDSSEETMTVVDVHLENTARPSGRTRQAEAVVDAVDAINARAAIVGGDFNDVLGPIEGVDRVLRGAGFRCEPAVGGLWPRIDRVYSRQRAMRFLGAMSIGGSDHRPVVIELEAA